MAFLDPLEIPLPSDTPLFSLRVPLDGVDFGFYFNYSAREDRWYMTISDADSAPIVAGVKVVENWPLLRRTSDSRRPTGELYAFDSLGEGPPGFHDLGPGRRVRLFYYPLAPVVSTVNGGLVGGG